MRGRILLLLVLAGLLLARCERTEPAPPVLALSPTPTAAPTATAAPTPTGTPIPTATPQPTPTEEPSPVMFVIVYDNNEYDPALQTGWGFACWIETGAGIILFDTGGDSPTLLGNMAQLGIDPQAIDVVVLSHIHGDHTGGLMGLLDTGARPVVYVPAAFPTSFKEAVRARTELVEVTEPVEVLPDIYATGAVSGSTIAEQALAVDVALQQIVDSL